MICSDTRFKKMLLLTQLDGLTHPREWMRHGYLAESCLTQTFRMLCLNALAGYLLPEQEERSEGCCLQAAKEPVRCYSASPRNRPKPCSYLLLSVSEPAKSFEPMDIDVLTQETSQLVVCNVTVEAHPLWQDKLSGASHCQGGYDALPEVVILEQAV